MKNYIALFEEGKKGGYSVVFPDVPGVITAGWGDWAERIVV